MRPPARTRVSDPIVDQIRREVFGGVRRPGDRLPAEMELAQQFGISRPAVREALRVLEMQGLVRVQYGYGGGAFVGEPGLQPVLGALETSLQRAQVSVGELYQSRMLFEPTIARLAVECNNTELVPLLSDNVARTEAALGRGEKAFGLNLEFHAALARAAGNRVVALVMQALLELLDRLDHEFPTNDAISRGALEEHRQIRDAVRGGEASRVEALMIGHLLRLEGRFTEMEARLDGPGGEAAPAMK